MTISACRASSILKTVPESPSDFTLCPTSENSSTTKKTRLESLGFLITDRMLFRGFQKYRLIKLMFSYYSATCRKSTSFVVYVGCM